MVTSCNESLDIQGVNVKRLVEALEGLNFVVGLEVLDSVVDVFVGPLAVLRLLQRAGVVLGRVLTYRSYN